MIWNSFKDKKGLVQSFEVDKYQEDILRFIESSIKAVPLVAQKRWSHLFEQLKAYL